MTVANITKAIAVLGGLFSSAMTFYAGELSDLYLVFLAALLGVWAALPFGLVYNRANTIAHSSMVGAIWFAVSVVLAASSFFAYWFTFINNATPDAQDGLVFLIIPFYQLLVVGVVFVAVRWLSRLLNSGS